MNNIFIPESPDYKHFARLPHWTIDEAINLLAMTQIRNQHFSDEETFNNALNQETSKIDTVLNIRDESGNCAWHYMMVYPDYLPGVPIQFHPIYPEMFSEWAIKLGYTSIPTEVTIIEEISPSPLGQSSVNGPISNTSIIMGANNGFSKTKGWRDRQLTEIIKILGKRELEAGCRCVHLRLAEHLLEDAVFQAKKTIDCRNLDDKQLENKVVILSRSALKALFYCLGDQYEKVNTRVVRGAGYIPPERPCNYHPQVKNPHP